MVEAACLVAEPNCRMAGVYPIQKGRSSRPITEHPIHPRRVSDGLRRKFHQNRRRDLRLVIVDRFDFGWFAVNAP